MKIFDEEDTVFTADADETLADVRRAQAARGAQPPELTIFLPVNNEEPNLVPLHVKLDEALSTLGRTSEIIYVDDGSTDDSLKVLRHLASRDSRVRVIALRRNYGKMAAMVAGIDAARGSTLVALDADLQNDPADIERLLAKLDEGYDVVSGWRVDRQDKEWSRKLPSRLANRLISWVSGVHLHDYGCCLKAYRREVLQDVNFYGEMHRFIPIYAAHQAGARVAELPVRHHPRIAGVSKFGKLSRTFEVILDLITIKYMEDYRTKPMHLFGYAGFYMFAAAGVMLLVALVSWLVGAGAVAGVSVILLFVLLGFGVQSILLGLLSETLMRTYYESQRKPTYHVRERIGFDDSADAARATANATERVGARV